MEKALQQRTRQNRDVSTLSRDSLAISLNNINALWELIRLIVWEELQKLHVAPASVQRPALAEVVREKIRQAVQVPERSETSQHKVRQPQPCMSYTEAARSSLSPIFYDVSNVLDLLGVRAVEQATRLVARHSWLKHTHLARATYGAPQTKGPCVFIAVKPITSTGCVPTNELDSLNFH